MKNAKVILAAAILLIAFAGGGFYAGMKYQQSQRGRFSGQFNGQQGNHMGQLQQRFGQGTRPVRGEIISQDDKSITVKLPDGSSKIILFSDNTSINKAVEGSKDDLKVGEQVLILGNENSDGSVTAQNIQLNPVLRESSGSPRPTGTNQ